MSENLYHLIAEKEWNLVKRDKTSYSPESLAKEGFIHLSLLRQLPGVVKRFYSHRTDLLVLVIDRKKLHALLQFDRADGDEFPHLYGPLNLEAIIEVQPLQKVISL